MVEAIWIIVMEIIVDNSKTIIIKISFMLKITMVMINLMIGMKVGMIILLTMIIMDIQRLLSHKKMHFLNNN